MSKTTEELTVTFFAEDFGLPKSVTKIVVNGGNAVYRIENEIFSILGYGLADYCNDPLSAIIATIQNKNPEIPEGEIKAEINGELDNHCIFTTNLLEKIYLEGLKLTFKIETSEIFPKTSETNER